MTSNMKKLLASASVLATLVTPAFADEFRIDRLFVAGDSLSDGGTYSQAIIAGSGGTAPSINYRFTNNNPDGSSRTYAEVLASELGISVQPNLITGVPIAAGTPLADDVNVGGTNYAQGGSRVSLAAANQEIPDATTGFTPTQTGITQTPVTVQVDRMIASTPRFTNNDLVVLWAGANDILTNSQFVGAGAVSPDDAAAAMGAAATTMIGQVDRVIAHGATNVVVVTVPDIGSATPLGAGSTPQGAGLLSGLTQAYNNTLIAGVGGRVTVVDSTAILQNVLDDPTRYGFSGINQLGSVECTGSSVSCLQGVNTVSDGNTRMFADAVHPSELTHFIFGQMANSTLTAVGQVGAMPTATLSALRQQSIGLENRLNLGAFFINDETGTRVRRPVGSVEVYGGAEAGFYSSDQQQVVPGFDASTQVVKAAADVMVAPNVMLGVGASIDHGQVDFDQNRGGFDSRLFVGALFGVAQIMPGIYVNGVLGGGLIDVYDIDRNFGLRDLNGNTVTTESYSADTTGDYFIAKASVGGVLPVGNGFFVNPSVGFAFEKVNIDGYSETATNGSAAGLAGTYGDQDIEGQRLTVALAGFYRPPSNPTWTLGMRASYEHDFNDDPIVVRHGNGRSLTNPNGSPLGVSEAPRADDSYAFLSATVTKELSHSTSLTALGSTVVAQDGIDGYTFSLLLKHSF